MDDITYRPIGTVRSPYENPEDVPLSPDTAADATGTVEIDEQYAAGLVGLDGFSHVVLLTHLHRVDDYVLRTDPPFAEGARPGIFATRGPRRPNPIGLSIVRLRDVDGTVLHVEGVDLVDGTPLLDIKPFAPKPGEAEDVERGWIDEHLEQPPVE